jgi:Bacterial Ig domain
MYLTTTATAADANLTLETSNPNIDYEIDSISIRRMNAVTKNTTANEVLIFSNSGAALYNQPCPGGVPCFAYVDGLNATIWWPIAVDPYRTSFVLWNGSPNILNAPVCSLNISAGSVPTGLPVDVDWTVTNSLSQILNYETYTGVINTPVASTGMVTFIPPYDNITTISLDAINDVGPRQCSIQVTTTNTAPYINSTTTTGSEDVAQINGTLSGVDLNPGDSIFFAQNGANVSNGTLNVDLSGSFQYFPNPDFCGNDVFDFHAYDQLWHYADAVPHTVSVACINDIPVANNDTGTGIAGAPLLINVIANDTDADSPYQAQTLTITGYTTPLNGTLTVNGNQLEYTPNIVFSGTEVFDYIISDQDGAISNTGTVTVGVTFANIPPTAQSEVYTLNEDSTLADTLTGSDANNDILTFAATVLPTNGTLNLLSDGTFTYIPDANYFGSDSFTFVVNDGVIDSSWATVSITVDPVFDAPIVSDDSYSLSQDTVLSVPVMNNDTDVDSALLSILAYTNPSNGGVVVSGTGFTYNPNALYIGPDSFTYSIIDGDGLISNTGTVTLNVTITNNPPVANSDTYNLNEDSQYAGTLSGTDIELSTLTYNVLTQPVNGTLVSTNTGEFTYTPDADYSGTDSFTFEVSDGVNTSNTATITLNVSAINDAPVSVGGSFTATGNSMSNSGNILLGSVIWTDIDSGSLTFSSSTLPANGALVLLSDGTFSYTPALGYVGTDSFVFTVSDGLLVSTGSTVTLTVINAAIPAPTVNMSASPSAVYSSGTTNVVWSSTNATSCITPWGSTATGWSYTTPELVSSTSYSINCTGLGWTTVRNVTINILPPPSSPPSTIWIGWGWSPGSYAPAVYYNIVNIKDVATNSGTKIDDPLNIDDIELESAPSSESQPVFAIDDPTGLLWQLFLTNRYLIDPYAPYNNQNNNTENQYTNGVVEVTGQNEVQNQESVPQAFDILDSVELDEYQGPTLLRYLARMFIAESNVSSDPISNYDYGIELMNSFDFADYSRLAFTRDYIIRIFEQQKRRYEEMIYRSVSNTYDDTYNSAAEEADLNTDTDPGFIEEEYNTYDDESADLDTLLAQLGQDEF